MKYLLSFMGVLEEGYGKVKMERGKGGERGRMKLREEGSDR